jgi:outer membrane protein OmpA-like peptidoglycan-associated protein
MSYLKCLKRTQLEDHKMRNLIFGTALTIFLTPVANANVIGSPFQNFTPAVHSDDSTTVQSSKTLGMGQFAFGLFLNQAWNTLPYDIQSQAGQSQSGFSNGLLGSEIAISAGVLPMLDVGISMPAIISQSQDNDTPRGQFSETGVTDYRLFTKARLMKMGGLGLALAASTSINQTVNNPYLGNTDTPIYNIEFIADYQTGRWLLSGNLGYRWLNSGPSAPQVPIQPFGNQLIMASSLGYKVTSKLQTILEIYGAQSDRVETDYSGRDSANAESILGVKYMTSNAMTLHSGVGTELQHGTSTPDLRLYAGLQWQTGSKSTLPTRVSKVRLAKATPKKTNAPERIILVADVLFKLNSTVISNSAKTRKNLNDLVKSINTPPTLERLVIEGHTCNMGSSTYNRDLSRKRAKAVRDILVTKYKVPANKILIVGMGETRPMTSNTSELGRRKNRRVELKIYRKLSASPAALAQTKTKR